MHILEKAKEIFDILEYSFVPSLQSVLPAIYRLGDFWSDLSTADTVAGHVLKRNLVTALDSKMWEAIIALHVAASYLDLVKDTGKRTIYQSMQQISLNRIP